MCKQSGFIIQNTSWTGLADIISITAFPQPDNALLVALLNQRLLEANHNFQAVSLPVQSVEFLFIDT